MPSPHDPTPPRGDPGSPGRARAIAFRVAALIFATVAGVYGFEIVFRQAFLAEAVPRSEREFERMVSASWPRQVAAERSAGTIRILGLSDSFGVSGGAENYHYLLVDALERRGHTVEMVNLSVVAYSPAQQLQMLREWGERYRPDIVLQGFFIGNDFAAPALEKLTFRGIAVDRIEGFESWLPQNLTSLQWLAQWRHVLADRRQKTASDGDGVDGTFSRDGFLRIQRSRLSTCKRPEEATEYWPYTTYLLDAISAEAQRIEAAHVIVVHPDQFQVETELLREIVDTYRLDRALYDPGLPQRYLHAYAGSRETTLIDLTPGFRAEGAQGGLYLPLDTHYNAAGNRLAAAAIAERLAPMLARLQLPALPQDPL